MDRKTLEQNYQKSFGASPAAELEQNYQRSGIASLVQAVKKATQYNPSSPSTQPTQAAPAGASSRKQSDAMKEQLDTIKKQRDDAAIKAGAYMRAGNMPQQAKEQQKIANKAAIEYENAYTQWKNQRNAEAVEDYNPDENKFKAGDAVLSGVQNAFQSMRQYAAAASSYLSGNPEAQAWEAKALMDSGVSGTEAVKRAGLADKREIPITDYKTQAELRHEKNVASVGAVEGGALQLVNTISNMVPSLVANAVLPGSGLPVMAASAAGNKYADAYEKYGNTDTAFVLGSAAGGASMLTEQFGGLYGSLGKSAAGQAVAKKLMTEAPGLYNLANSVGGKWLRDALSEGIEEGAEDVINYAIEKALTGDSDEMDNFGYDMLLGALAGGVFGGGNAAMRSVTYSRVGKALNASPAAVAQQVQEGMEKGAGTAPAIYAAEVQKNPSNQMVGRLYEANLTYDAESGLSKIQNDITQVSINEIKAMVSKADALAQAAQKLNVEATPQAVATAITDAQRTQSIKTAEDSVGQAFAPTVDNPANAGEKAYNSALAGVAANQGVAARINNDPAARQAFSQLTGVQFSGNTAQDIAAIEVATQNIAKSGKQAISQAEYAQRVAAAGEQAAAQFDADMQAQAEQMQRESDERWLSVEQNTITDVDGKRRIKEITNTDVRGNTEIGYKKAEIPGSKKKTVAEVNNAAKYLGKTIVWFEGAVQVNGQYRLTNGYRAPDGTIYVNINSRDPLMVTFGHEMFHDLVADSKYSGLIDTLVENPDYADMVKGMMNAKTELYERNGIELDPNAAAEEVAADISGDLLGSRDMLEYIGARNTEAATGIKGFLNRILKKLKGKPSAQEAYNRLSESQKALLDGMEGKAETGVNGSESFSLIDVAPNGMEIYETSLATQQLSESQKKKRYLALIKNQYRGRTARLERNGHVVYVRPDIQEAGKPIYGDRRSTANGAKALRNSLAEGDVFDLLENAEYDRSSRDTKNHKNADYFDYYVKTVQIDGKVYDLVADVKRAYGNSDGLYYTLYLVDNITKKAVVSQRPQTLGSSEPITASEMGSNSFSADMVPQSDTAVNNYSMQNSAEDTSGKHSLMDIPAMDSEYSAAVESGNMQEAQRLVDEAAKAAGYNSEPLYHGTKSFGFTKIDTAQADDKMSFFATSNPDMAQTYSGKKGNKAINNAAGNTRAMPIEDVVNRLKEEASNDGYEVGSSYRIMKRADVKSFLADLDRRIESLNDVIARKVDEYADRLAEDFSQNNITAHDTLVRLLEATENYRYSGMSTPLWMLSKHTDVFNESEKKLVGEIEADVRLRNRLEARGGSDDVVVREDLDRYSISVMSFAEAREELAKLSASGNYSLRGRTDNFLDVDGNNHNWNEIFTTLEPKGGNNFLAEYDQDTGSVIMSDKDGRFAEVHASTLSDALPGMARAITKKFGSYFAPQILSSAKDQLRNGATAEVAVKSTGKMSTRDIAKFAKEQGYRGVKISNIYDNGGGGKDAGAGDVYIFFYPEEDVKSADPVTYDDAGNVIPLSERFNNSNSDIRYSLMDTDSTGRKLSQQQQEYFKDSKVIDGNGNLLVMYHGTTAFGYITKFKRGKKGWLGPGIYLTSKRSDAQRYADAMGEGNGRLYEMYANITKPLVVTDGNPVPGILKAAYGRDSVYKSRSEKQASDPSIVTQADINKLRTKGYDGIVWDYGGDKEVSVFSPEQVKLADNVDPTSSQDIRYSLMEDAQYMADIDRVVSEATEKANDELKAAQAEVKNIRQQLADYRQQATAEAKNTAAWKEGEAKLIADLSEAQSKEKKARVLSSYMDEYNALSERYRGEVRATDTEALTQYNEKLSTLRSGFRGEMEKLAIEQGAFKRGEKAARDIYVPTSVNGQKVTRGTRTILEASQTPDSMLEEHAKEILAGARGYEVISDKKAQEYAERIIDKEGYDKADELFTNAVNGDQVLDKKTLVLGEYLYMEAAKAGDVKNAMRYAADVAAAATRAGQVVQAMRVLKKATPTGKLYYLNRMVDTMNKNIVDNGGDPIQIDEGLARKLLEAENIKDPKEQGKAVDETIDEIEQNIADQIPATAWDKWNAWRYLSMLGNIRTQVRNVVGNAAFMPLVATKNLLAAGMEKAFIRNGGRTKSAFFTKTNVGKRLMEFGKKDFDTVVDEIQGGGKYNQSSSIEEKRTIFKSKAIEGWRKLTNKAMDKGDEIFSKHHYARALAGYLYANHLDYDKITRNTPQAQEVLNKARTYAILEAQKATFRDANQFASFINKAKRNLLKKAQTAETKGAKAGWYVGTALAEGVMPFTKTPIDIAVRGIEYSPIGLIKGIKEAVYDVKKGNKTAAEAIDTLSAGLTGTGIFALGYFLQSLGFLAGALGSDKDEKYKKDSGAQGFALHIGDKYYTIDWLAPFSLPLFTGAAVAETVENGDEVSFATLADALSTISEPMLEMSMLQGLNAALSSGKYGDEAAIASFVTTNGFSYLAQANPTILGQIARAVDDTSRNAYYYDPNYKGFVKQVKVFVDKQLAKVPFASKVLTSRIDLWGNKQENTGGSFFGRLAYNMLSPGYYSEESNDPVDVALTKLYEETEDTAVLPSKPKKSFKNNKTTYKMNAKQYEEFCIVEGQTAHKEIQAFINSAEYKKMSNEDRVGVLDRLYTYSAYKAQKNLLGDKYVTPPTYGPYVKAEAYAKGGNPVYKYFLKG